MDIPEVDISQVEDSTDKVVVPVGLKQRWKPFGWSKLIFSRTLLLFVFRSLKCDGLFQSLFVMVILCHSLNHQFLYAMDQNITELSSIIIKVDTHSSGGMHGSYQLCALVYLWNILLMYQVLTEFLKSAEPLAP